uniref:Uncharacterized protein n=1 Tax=Arundo donax TaxID=35708 RepID=A0A0A9HE81_ARUDO
MKQMSCHTHILIPLNKSKQVIRKHKNLNQ